MTRFSFILPTVGRPTLTRALKSLAAQPLKPQDEVLVIGGDEVLEIVREFRIRNTGMYRHVPCAPGLDFGCAERSLGISLATGTHLAFLDDDDAYLPGAVEQMRLRADQFPGRPIMFRMIAPSGVVLWRDQVVRCGNHGSPQFVTPNDRDKVGSWSTRYEGDFDFCVSTLAHYPPNSLVWDATVIYACRQWADRVWGMSCAS